MSSSSSPPQQNGLVEFRNVPMWRENFRTECLYEKEKLMPPYEYFYQKAAARLNEILKPRPTVQPLVRRKRRIHQLSNNAVVPGFSCESSQSLAAATLSVEVPETRPTEESSENRLTEPTSSCRKTARKSTSGKTFKVRSSPEILKNENPCRISLINLKQSNLANYVMPMLMQYELRRKEEEMKSSIKICERKDSTDSGLASEDEETVKTIPPVKINLVNLPRKKRAAPPSSSYLSKKKKIDNLLNGQKSEKGSSKDVLNSKSPKHLNTGGATPIAKRGPKKKTLGNSKCPTKGIRKREPAKQKPSIPVSIPWDQHLRVVLPDVRTRYLENNEVEGITDKTILPKDVVPTLEFDVRTLQMSPLATKRYKDPPPLRFFSPYEGGKNVCISCNINFQSRQDLANHKLANHHTFNY